MKSLWFLVGVVVTAITIDDLRQHRQAYENERLTERAIRLNSERGEMLNTCLATLTDERRAIDLELALVGLNKQLESTSYISKGGTMHDHEDDVARRRSVSFHRDIHEARMPRRKVGSGGGDEAPGEGTGESSEGGSGISPVPTEQPGPKDGG